MMSSAVIYCYVCTGLGVLVAGVDFGKGKVSNGVVGLVVAGITFACGYFG